LVKSEAASETQQPERRWWAELGSAVPRAVAVAARAAKPPADADCPPLAVNPLTWATLAVDELTMSTAYLLSRRSGVQQDTLDDAREAVRRLDAAGLLDDPAAVFPAPRPPVAPRATHRRRAGLDFEHLSFHTPSPLPVELPRSRAWSSSHATAHAYLLRHGDRVRPWVVVLHGHRMGEPRDLRLLGSHRLARALGVDVAHLVLPMHGPRGRGTRHAFPGLDPLTNFFGFAQSVWDARALLAGLRAEGAETVGVYGVSLGGHVAGLLAALEPDLACVVAGVPTSDVAMMLTETVRQHWGPEAVAASGVEDEAFRTLSRLVSPLALPVAVPRERLFLYAAVGDRLVTPQQAIALWRHWDRPAILWLQGGHILNNVGASRRFVVESLAASGVRCPEEVDPCAS
jgi:dienelactone hydrolase